MIRSKLLVQMKLNVVPYFPLKFLGICLYLGAAACLAQPDLPRLGDRISGTVSSGSGISHGAAVPEPVATWRTDDS